MIDRQILLPLRTFSTVGGRGICNTFETILSCIFKNILEHFIEGGRCILNPIEAVYSSTFENILEHFILVGWLTFCTRWVVNSKAMH